MLKSNKKVNSSKDHSVNLNIMSACKKCGKTKNDVPYTEDFLIMEASGLCELCLLDEIGENVFDGRSELQRHLDYLAG